MWDISTVRRAPGATLARWGRPDPLGEVAAKIDSGAQCVKLRGSAAQGGLSGLLARGGITTKARRDEGTRRFLGLTPASSFWENIAARSRWWACRGRLFGAWLRP